VLDVYRVDESSSVETDLCARSNQVLLEYLKRERVRYVLLVSHWSRYTEGIEVPMQGAGTRNAFYADRSTRSRSVGDAREVFDRNFRGTIRKLGDAGVKIWIVTPVPTYKYWVPNEAAKTLTRGGDINSLTRPYAEYQSRTARLRALFRELHDQAGVGLIDPTERLCGAGVCRAVVDNRVLYRDSNHLSIDGTGYIRPLFAPLVSEIRR
jgi:SGNH domain-containing protein